MYRMTNPTHIAILLVVFVAPMASEAYGASDDDFFNSPWDIWTVTSVVVNVTLIWVVIWQMQAHKKEMDSRLRPWVGRKSSVKQGYILDDPDTGQKFIRIEIENHGSLPARDIRSKLYVLDDRPDENVFDDRESDSPASLLPHEDFKIAIPLDEKQHKSPVLYYGLQLTYLVNDKTTGKYEMRGRIRPGSNSIDSVTAS